MPAAKGSARTPLGPKYIYLAAFHVPCWACSYNCRMWLSYKCEVFTLCLSTTPNIKASFMKIGFYFPAFSCIDDLTSGLDLLP